MEISSTYPEEYWNSLRQCLNYLKRIQFTIDTGPMPGKRLFYFVTMITCVSLHLLSMFAYIFKMFLKGQNIFHEADIIPVILVIVQVLLKVGLIMNKKIEIGNVIDLLGENWRTTDLTEEQIKKKKASLKHSILGQKLLNRLSALSSWQYMLFPLLETLFRKFVLQQEYRLLLPFSAVYPFSTDNWTNYIAVYIFQIYSIMCVVYMYIGPDMLLITLCTLLSNQFVLLQEDLGKIRPANRKRAIVRTRVEESGLREFVNRHQSVILLTNHLNAAFNTIIFVNLLFAGLIICFFAIAAKASKGAAYMVNNLAAIIVILTNMFVLCYCSEVLCTSSTGIADRAFQTKWHEADIAFRKNIRIIIMRSQKPCSLTSLNYSAISLNTFTKVLSTTWSYFSLANSLYEERD